MTETVDAIPAGAKVRLTHCPDCNYSLTGLPEQGLCPECGFAYSPAMLVFYGWEAVGATIYQRSAWRSAISMIPFAVWFFIYFLSPVVGGGRPLPLPFPPSVLLAIGVVWLLLELNGIRTRRALVASHSAPLQLRLQPDGFAMRFGAGRVQLHRWDPAVIATAKPLKRGRIEITLRRPVSFWKLFSRATIDFKFEFDPPAGVTAEGLSTLMQSYVARAAH